MHFVLSFLILIPTSILVCVFFAPPSLLTVSFEMIFLLVLVTFFCTTKQQYEVLSCERVSSSIPSHSMLRGMVTKLLGTSIDQG